MNPLRAVPATLLLASLVYPLAALASSNALQSLSVSDPVPAVRTAAELHEQAVKLFSHARKAEAYGRFINLADAGHAPAAHLAMLMCQRGPELFGRDWDCSPEQLQDWARTAGVAAPAMRVQSYGRKAVGAATLGEALPAGRRDARAVTARTVPACRDAVQPTTVAQSARTGPLPCSP